MQWLVRPEEVVLLMLNSLAGFTSRHRLQLLLRTVGAVTSGFALCARAGESTGVVGGMGAKVS